MVSVRIVVLLIVAIAVDAEAQGRAVVSPAKGQSRQQQAQDEAHCRASAQRQTGPAPGAPPRGGQVRGTTPGAAAGTVLGGIAHDSHRNMASGGAAIGAVAGRGGSQRASGAQQAEAADVGARAFTACMKGRGYTVK